MFQNKTAIANKERQILRVVNWRNALEKAVLNPAVNIKIAPLGGDEIMVMGVAELGPGAKINAHVHGCDVEFYHILKGEGEIFIGTLDEEAVCWDVPVKVQDGDVFAIDPGMVHQLKNTSDKDSLVLIFSAPHTHLRGDRLVTEDYRGSQKV